MVLMRVYTLSILFTTILFVAGCRTHAKMGGNTVENAAILTFINANGERVPVLSKDEWRQKRLQILDNMQKGMGILPDRSGLPDFDQRITDSLSGNNYIRYTINFSVSENERVTAYLYVPDKVEKRKRFPAMLALHETDPIGKGSVDGQGSNLNLAYAKELAQRGYVVIAPDYPGFGDRKDYDFDKDRYQSGTIKGIFDHMRCVDLLQSLPYVDPDRIGVIGHSLGGHNAIFAGAFDTRLKIVISSCGWTGFGYYNVGEKAMERYGGRLGPWAIPRYMPLLREKYNLDEKKIPFDFDEIIASLAPRIFFSNSPVHDANFDVKGVKEGIRNALNVYKFLGASDNLQVYYPEAKHDFPAEIRIKAYELIDQVFHHHS